MPFLFTDSPRKLKLEKTHGILIILFYVSLTFPSCKEFAFFTKNTKNNHSSAKDKWKYTKYCSKENTRTCSKNSTAQGNIRISRLKKRL